MTDLPTPRRASWPAMLGVCLLTALACARQPVPEVVPEDVSEPPATVLPRVTLPDGVVVTLELATTPEERSQGLMYRQSLPEDRGMLFLFEMPAPWPFWMKDTWVPLDLVFLDSSGTVVEVLADAEPCPAEPCPQYVPEHEASAVLELLAGAAGRHRVEPGASLAFNGVEGYPKEAAPLS